MMYEENYIQKGQIDFNDTLFVRERLPSDIDIVETIPAPVTVFESGVHKGKQKINPHVSRFVLSNGEQVDVFHVKPVYYQNQSGNWRPMSEIASHYGNKSIILKEDWADNAEYAFISWLIRRTELLGGQVLIPSPLKYVPVSMYARENYASLHFSTLTAYPDPNPETSTVDGRSQWFSGSGVWSTAHPATDGTSADDSSANMYFQVYHRAGSNLGIDRMFYLFDTSALTSGATISAGVLSIYFDQKNDQEADAQSYFNVVQSSPASNTAITTADFDQCGAVTNPTKGASDYAFSSLPAVNNYADFTLNATGRGWISKTGITKLGVREGHDIEDVDPNAGGDGVYLHVLCAETSGTTTDPKLVVTYSTTVDVTVSATVLSSTFSIPSYTVTAQRQVTVSPSVLSATFSTPAYSVKTDVTVSPSVLSATFSIPAYDVRIADVQISPSALAMTFSIPTYTVTAIANVSISPSVLGITVSIPTYTITTIRHITISPEIITMVISIPTYFARGDFWQEKFPTVTKSWTDKFGGGA